MDWERELLDESELEELEPEYTVELETEDIALDELVQVYAAGVESEGSPREDEDENDCSGYPLGEFAEGNAE